MQNHHSTGELRTLSEDELRQVTGGNSAFAKGLSAFFSGLNAVVRAVEGLIIKASHNDPKVVAGINTFNQIGVGIENVAVGVASVI